VLVCLPDQYAKGLHRILASPSKIWSLRGIPSVLIS
jgi:hypothetical protein